MKMEEKQQKITKDTTIGEVIEKYPQIVPTLFGFGLHCVSCHVATFESLEIGFKAHGLSDKEIEEAVKKLNEVIEKK